MSEKNSRWINLTARLVRVLLARKDIGYAELSERLQLYGVDEDEKALARRVSLGQVRLSLFLQILTVTGAPVPTLWSVFIKTDGSWEDRAISVLRAELEECPAMKPDELMQKILTMGVSLPEVKLTNQLANGTFSVPVFLRALVVLRSPSLDAYLDYSDLLAAAKAELST